MCTSQTCYTPRESREGRDLARFGEVWRESRNRLVSGTQARHTSADVIRVRFSSLIGYVPSRDKVKTGPVGRGWDVLVWLNHA